MASRFIFFSWHLVPVASGHTHTHQLLFVPWQACGGRVEETERMALAYLTMALGLTAVGAAALVYTKFSLLLYSLDNRTWVSVSHLWSRRDCDGVAKSAQSKLHQPQLDADRRALCKADEGKSSILIVTDKPWPSSYHHPPALTLQRAVFATTQPPLQTHTDSPDIQITFPNRVCF